MQRFTGWQYLLIDVANQYGLDKELFETRIEWATKNLDKLEELASTADNKPLFLKACMAIRKAQQGIPSGHLVGFDGVCSGMQIMSALTGCLAGAEATGMVDPNKRADAYTAVTEAMNALLGNQGSDQIKVKRSDAKKATMTSLYGSKAQPVKIFGKDTAELDAFYAAMNQVAPGPWNLLQDLLASWQPNALAHEWQLPDGFNAKVKVMTKVDEDDPRSRVEVDELGHSSFTYVYYINEPQKKGLANAANVVHSIDAYVLRCIHRRCNYDREMVENVDQLMSIAVTTRALSCNINGSQEITDPNIEYYVGLWEETGMADVVILPHITAENVLQVPTELLRKLMGITFEMLQHKPFPVVTIHDEFKCHPNNMNVLRQQYINVMAELAESTVLDYILSSIYGRKGTYPKLSHNLGSYIRKSNYALS